MAFGAGQVARSVQRNVNEERKGRCVLTVRIIFSGAGTFEALDSRQLFSTSRNTIMRQHVRAMFHSAWFVVFMLPNSHNYELSKFVSIHQSLKLNHNHTEAFSGHQGTRHCDKGASVLRINSQIYTL